VNIASIKTTLYLDPIVVYLGGRLRHLFPSLFVVILTFNATAQTPVASSLNDYQGHYEYEGLSTLDIIAKEDLFAILDEAKYRLPASGTDTFLNGGGEKIAFRRDANGIKAHLRAGISFDNCFFFS